VSEPTDAPHIVCITSLSVSASEVGRGKDRRTETTRFTVYGADASGRERVYVEHTSEEEHVAWRASDPLWREALSAMVDRLLADPATRDTVLQINIAAALEEGDTETAITPAKALSPKRFLELFGDLKEHTATAEGDQT
jgi:hypothetical protein